ncbi:hypothetical protein H5187_08100 [Pseudoalteromonas sp. SG44-1]|uniref:hypothetical protein n=1 Tax=Pseudoalteromonas sp. SG44-1 TaxID=2760964 RepID=UPI00160039CA|nr:hypothetical protein [Pseudoalteromonas sp. SG44-1]MBB1417238.1 hypothetical protein [Pseudoalteromonas sp. SG44-1]
MLGNTPNLSKLLICSNHKKTTKLMGLYKKFGVNGNVKFHFISIEDVIDVMSQKEIAMEQNNLLEKYLEHPRNNITLDCDKLVFNANISEKDYMRFCQNFYRVKTSEKRKLLDIRLRFPQESEKHIGHYICQKVFTINASTNEFNKVFIYLCIDKDKNRMLHVVFTPRLFDDIELSVIFHHLLTVLGRTRYVQIFSKARLSRVDIGFNLPCISKASLIVMPKHNRCRVSNNYPNRDEQGYLYVDTESRVSESYYCGSQKGSHLVVYDSFLNNLNKKNHVVGLTSRVEYRYKLHANKEHVTIATLNEVKPILHLYSFVRPWVFKCLPIQLTEIMITNQGIASIRRAWEEAKLCLKKRGKEITTNKRKRKGLVSLNESWLFYEQSKLLLHYRLILLNPKSSSLMIKQFKARK